MGFPVSWHSHTTALRMNLGVQSQGPTSQGATLRVRRLPAVSSTYSEMWSWACSRDAGQSVVMGPSAIALTTLALSSPHAMRMIFLEESIVPIPRVMALSGVADMSWLKFFACLLREL